MEADMTATSTHLIQATRGNRPSWFYATSFMAAFAVVLVLACAGAAMGLNWRSWLPGAENRGSLLGSVMAAVSSFMSYLP
jgi:light-harvesting complex 1 beta chain